MNIPLRVLIVEDREDDSRLMVHELQKAGYQVTHRRVETNEEMQTALAEESFDVVLADYNMPLFSGSAALDIYLNSRQDIPFIIVSGVVEEESAIRMIKKGAHDFISKDNMSRLAKVVGRELLRAREQRKVKRFRQELSRQYRVDEPAHFFSSRYMIFFIASLVLILSAILWKFVLASRWTQRIPPGWQMQSSFIGYATIPDPVTLHYPEKDTASFYTRFIRALPENRTSGSVTIEDIYSIEDPKTRKKVYEYMYRASLDPGTGRHLNPEFRGDYYLFPRKVKKQTYRIRMSYIKGIPLSFDGEEKIEGIKVYSFFYKGAAEYTESYEGTKDYPGIKVAPGQEIRCFDDQFVLHFWVEPVTGEMIKWEEGCASGDYVYDKASGKPVSCALRWGGITTGDDVLLRVQQVQNLKSAFLWCDQYLPALLLFLGVAGMGMALFLRKKTIDIRFARHAGPDPASRINGP